MNETLDITPFGMRCRQALAHRWKNDAHAQSKAAKALSEKLGKTVKPQTVQNMCTKANSSQLTFDLSEICGVSYHWLRTGEGEMLEPKTYWDRQTPAQKLDEAPPTPANERVYVSRLSGVKIRAGTGEVVFDFEEIDESHAFNRDWMQSEGLLAEYCKLIDVDGDSMFPTLEAGETIMVNTRDRTPRHNKIFALIGEDGIRVKRLIHRADGVWEIHSDNPAKHLYPTEVFVQGQVAIWGRVRWHAGTL